MKRHPNGRFIEFQIKKHQLNFKPFYNMQCMILIMECLHYDNWKTRANWIHPEQITRKVIIGFWNNVSRWNVIMLDNSNELNNETLWRLLSLEQYFDEEWQRYWMKNRFLRENLVSFSEICSFFPILISQAIEYDAVISCIFKWHSFAGNIH